MWEDFMLFSWIVVCNCWNVYEIDCVNKGIEVFDLVYVW